MSSKEKTFLAAAGVVGTSVLTWRTLCPWLMDDIRTIRSTNKQSKRIAEDIAKNRFLIDMFEEQVSRVPKKPFILFNDREYTYEFVDSMANRVAGLAKTWNLKQGDAVATMIYNEPAFVWTFLGLLKLGLVDAFINYNLRSKALLHSLTISEAKVIIVGEGEDLLESLNEIKDQLPVELPIYIQGKKQKDLSRGYLSIDDILRRFPPVPVCRIVRSNLNLRSLVCYIYTSGTTGLPKAVKVNQAKAIGLSKFYQQIDYNENDTTYVATPLYHSAAAGHGLFNTMDVGATIVLRRKFSVTHYWQDVRKYNVTVLQYIGELCRYLLKAPKSPLDGVHKVRVAMGNGLRPDIWEEYITRFKIPRIAEFFGATEGTSTFINTTGKIGALGRWSPLMAYASTGRQGVTNHVIKYDPMTEGPLRDKNGRCVKVKSGEEGLLIAGIPPSYTGFYKGPPELNEKKIIRDAFQDGDKYFNFGDLVYTDKDYYLYFRDRVGDTFRWKGENVSTREVCNVICTLDFVHDVNVYGVKIPDSDGRAGMAAIVLEDNHEITQELLEKVYKKCTHELPSYACPIFLRFQNEFTVTQTMKQRKVELVEEGFNPEKIEDKLFYRNQQLQTYTPLTFSSYKNIPLSKL